jgi:hypothetical protein
MMISSLMSKSGADIELGNLLGKFLKRLFHFSEYGLYAIFMGFFCGFPMGAKVVSELYEQDKLTKSEASALLSFCNNIGPSYFAGIIIPIIKSLGGGSILPYIFGMYGIPALYGIIAGFTLKKDPIPRSQKAKPPLSIFDNIKQSCAENTQALIILGGYITFTNAFRVILDFLPISGSYKSVLSAFIELTSGVQLIYQTTLLPQLKLFFIMTALSFGGLSCFMQTSSFLERSGLSLTSYMKHKLITTLLSSAYYFTIILIR